MSFKDLLGKKAATAAHEQDMGKELEDEVQKIINDCIEVEKKKLDAMSRLELIAYAAESRTYLNYNFTILCTAGERIKKLESTQDLLIDTINRMIKKQSVKIIDRSKL